MDGYLSDISRVFPVNGRFTREQRILYDLLENVQLTLIKEAMDGEELSLLRMRRVILQEISF